MNLKKASAKGLQFSLEHRVLLDYIPELDV